MRGPRPADGWGEGGRRWRKDNYLRCWSLARSFVGRGSRPQLPLSSRHVARDSRFCLQHLSDTVVKDEDIREREKPCVNSFEDRDPVILPETSVPCYFPAQRGAARRRLQRCDPSLPYKMQIETLTAAAAAAAAGSAMTGRLEALAARAAKDGPPTVKKCE